MLQVGAEVAELDGFSQLRGRRVAVVCNPSSLVRSPRSPRVRQHLVDVLRQHNIDIVKLFGPEHGLWSTAQDLIAVDAGRDAIFNSEVATLYGRSLDTLAPNQTALAGVDVLVFDVQDVGSRYYTYFATLCMAIDVCAKVGVEVVVFDRPNPLGGSVIEGNRVQEKYRSFVGWLDIPQRHGLSLGELARLHVAESASAAKLTVVACQDFDTSKFFDEQAWGSAGSTWYAPSPNMPSVAAAVTYPGTCLIEGTRLSEGRGTTRPFELIGAPWLDARRYAADLMAFGIAGWHARPMLFEPTFQKYAGKVCSGVALEVYDRVSFSSVRAGLALISAARRQDPGAFAWRTETYEFVSDRLAIDLLMGGTMAREVIEAGADLDEATADFANSQAEFADRARGILLYPRSSGLWA